MLVAAGLYVYDSVLLLYGNEGVVSPSGRQNWTIHFGIGIQIRGKNLLVPSPLLPHRPLFRLVWNANAGVAGNEHEWTERRALFEPLAPLVWGMLVSLFVLLPIGLFSRFGEPMVLAAIALLYFNILAAVGWLILKRATFGITGRRLAMLAFEAVICSPFAVNLVRKLSAEMRVNEDLVDAARRLQKPEDWDASRRRIIARIDEELDFEDQESGRASALKTLKNELAKG
jgi:hypothetical protein